MSNSSQFRPIPNVMIYPVPAAANQPQVQAQTQSQPSHLSNGSFGTVFIVLAVIIVISGIACFIGRLCNKRTLKSQQAKPKHSQRPGGPGGPPSPYPSPYPSNPHPSHPTGPNGPSFPPQQSGRQELDMEMGYPGSRGQVHPGPKDFSDTDNEFDKRSKNLDTKLAQGPENGEGMRGYGPSPFAGRKPDHQGYQPLSQLHGQRHGGSPGHSR